MPLPLAVPIASAGVGLLSQIFGGIQSGKRMDEAEGIIQGQKDDLQAWYDTESNQDFLSSNVARAAISKVLENIREQNKNIESTAAVTGASDASKIAMKGDNRQQFADVARELAAYGTRRGDQIDSQYRSEIGRILGTQANMKMQQAQNAGNLISSGGNLLGASGNLFGLTELFGDGGGSMPNSMSAFSNV